MTEHAPLGGSESQVEGCPLYPERPDFRHSPGACPYCDDRRDPNRLRRISEATGWPLTTITVCAVCDLQDCECDV